MSLFAYFEQEGGCDYTIACGKEMVDLDTDNPNEAVKRVKEYLEEHGSGCSPECTVDKVTIIRGEVVNIGFNLDAYHESIKEQEDEDNERAEYERLKEKYGD